MLESVNYIIHSSAPKSHKVVEINMVLLAFKNIFPFCQIYLDNSCEKGLQIIIAGIKAC